jgi:hypothetical protein
MTTASSRILVMLSSLVVSASLAAQAPQPSPTEPKSFCLRGQPLPQCRSWFVLEVTGAKRIVGTSAAQHINNPDLDEYVAWDLGVMRNMDSVRAKGWSLQVGGSSGGTRIAAKLRRRRWLDNHFTRDVAIGPLVAQEQSRNNTGVVEGFGAAAEAALGYNDLLGVMLDGDVLHVDGRQAAALHVGARAESFVGAVISSIAVLGVYILYRGLSSS